MDKESTHTMAQGAPRLETAAAALRALAAADGQLTPEGVLDAARPKSSPLHGHFEWDNRKAGEAFRLVQAAALIRRVRVTVRENPEGEGVTVRAFVLVRNEGEGEEDSPAFYMPLGQALASADWREQVLADAKRELATFRRKYAALSAAAKVLEAIDDFLVK
jgi:hypothetical protein